MSKFGANNEDDDFLKRRVEARKTVNEMDRKTRESSPDREGFFKSVYSVAGGDAAQVLWADMRPKDKLVQWLEGKSGSGFKALDIACGLGDHAELLAQKGYQTEAFDISPEAIEWAQQRFPGSDVSYSVQDIFNPPSEWLNGFDLVWECYTIQALNPGLRAKTTAAISSFVKPGGTLLVYSREVADNADINGPPWPLTDRELRAFSDLGFDLVLDDAFEIKRPDKTIPHRFMEWKKPYA